MFPQLKRWQRKMQGRPGWTLPGVKRREYVDSLNPYPKPVKQESKMPYVPPSILNAGICTGTTASNNLIAVNAWPYSTATTITANGIIDSTIYIQPQSWQISTAGTTADNLWNDYQQWTGQQLTQGLRVSRGLFYDDGWLGGGSWPRNIQWVNPRMQTPEERAAAEAAWQRQLKQDKLKQKLVVPQIITRQGREARASQLIEWERDGKAEITALRLLKGMLSEPEWRRYLTHGFIVVTGKTGLRYQIRRGQSHVRVYRQGEKVAELCVAVATKCPPTDHVIAKKILVDCDELGLWHRANIHQCSRMGYTHKPTEQELVQLAAA